MQVGYIVQPTMPDLSDPHRRDRRRPLYAYLEPIWAGRRMLEIGPGEAGAPSSCVARGRPGGVAERISAESTTFRPGAWSPRGRRWYAGRGGRRLPEAGGGEGRLVVAVANAERAGADGRRGLLRSARRGGAALPRVQMLGMTPFSGIGVVEFDGAVDALRIDARLVKEPEAPVAYVAIAGTDAVTGLGYALVQLPVGACRRSGEAGRARPPTAEAGASPCGPRSHVQAEEIEELRARLRRAAEDRAALDAENAKLRRALAEAERGGRESDPPDDGGDGGGRRPLAAGLRGPRRRRRGPRRRRWRRRAKRPIGCGSSWPRARPAPRPRSSDWRRWEPWRASGRPRLEDALERQRLAESELGRARRRRRASRRARTWWSTRARSRRGRAPSPQRDERILRSRGREAGSGLAARRARGQAAAGDRAGGRRARAGRERRRAASPAAGASRAGAAPPQQRRGRGGRALEELPPGVHGARRRAHGAQGVRRRAVGAGRRAGGHAGRRGGAGGGRERRSGDATQDRQGSGRGRSQPAGAAGRARGEALAPRARAQGGGGSATAPEVDRAARRAGSSSTNALPGYAVRRARSHGCAARARTKRSRAVTGARRAQRSRPRSRRRVGADAWGRRRHASRAAAGGRRRRVGSSPRSTITASGPAGCATISKGSGAGWIALVRRRFPVSSRSWARIWRSSAE